MLSAQTRNYVLIREISVSAIVAGVSATAILAPFNASIFPAAAHLPPGNLDPPEPATD
jgi:hypothetical protein